MKPMGLRMMGMKDGLTDMEGNFTQACCMISRPIRLLLDLLVPHNNASPIHNYGATFSYHILDTYVLNPDANSPLIL